jgi:hypothetical protein
MNNIMNDSNEIDLDLAIQQEIKIVNLICRKFACDIGAMRIIHEENIYLLRKDLWEDLRCLIPYKTKWDKEIFQDMKHALLINKHLDELIILKNISKCGKYKDHVLIRYDKIIDDFIKYLELRKTDAAILNKIIFINNHISENGFMRYMDLC